LCVAGLNGFSHTSRRVALYLVKSERKNIRKRKLIVIRLNSTAASRDTQAMNEFVIVHLDCPAFEDGSGAG